MVLVLSFKFNFEPNDFDFFLTLFIELIEVFEANFDLLFILADIILLFFNQSNTI
jgi:hypothetical protein